MKQELKFKSPKRERMKLDDRTFFTAIHTHQLWLIYKQIDPKQWGYANWQSILGFAWISCFLRRDWIPILRRILLIQPSLLLCRFCARHFYQYHRKHPMPSEIEAQLNPAALFVWLCRARQEIAQRKERCGEQCWIQLWFYEAIRTPQEWYVYFEKRILHFYCLWKFSVLMHLTATLRGLYGHPTRSFVQLPVSRFLVCRYISDCCTFLDIPNVFSQCMALQSEEQWKQWWQDCMVHVVGEQLANAIARLNETALKLFIPKHS
jgi:hypothetical protein